jgi:hypothetical protein
MIWEFLPCCPAGLTCPGAPWSRRRSSRQLPSGLPLQQGSVIAKQWPACSKLTFSMHPGVVLFAAWAFINSCAALCAAGAVEELPVPLVAGGPGATASRSARLRLQTTTLCHSNTGCASHCNAS